MEKLNNLKFDLSKVLLVFIILGALLIASCKKHERVPFNDNRVSIDYKNEFKENAKSFAESDLQYVAAYDSNSITLNDLSLASKYSVNSFIVAPPNLPEFGYQNMMRAITKIDTIGSTIKLTTREAHALEIFNGYTLGKITPETLGYNTSASRSYCDNINPLYTHYAFDSMACSYLKPASSNHDFICHTEEYSGTIPTSWLQIRSNYRAKVEVSYNYTVTTCVNDKQITSPIKEGKKFTLSGGRYEGTGVYLGRTKSEILTSHHIEWDCKVIVEQSGPVDNSEVSIWDWNPTAFNFTIPTLVGPISVEAGLEGELKLSKSKENGTGGVILSKTWEEVTQEVSDVYIHRNTFDNLHNQPLFFQEVKVYSNPSLTKKEEIFDGSVSYDPYFQLQLGASKQIRGHLYAYLEASWLKAAKTSVLSAKIECGPYLKIDAAKSDPLNSGTIGLDCGVELGLDLNTSVAFLTIDDVSLFTYEHGINGFPKVWIDWKFCDWIGGFNTNSDVNSSFFSYDVSNSGKSVSKLFVYETDGSRITSDNLSNQLCNVAFDDGTGKIIKENSIYPPSNFTEYPIYPTAVQGEPVKTNNLTEKQDIKLDFGKKYVVYIADLQTYMDNSSIFHNQNGELVLSLKNQLDNLVQSTGHYGMVEFELPLPTGSRPTELAIQVPLFGNGIVR